MRLYQQNAVKEKSRKRKDYQKNPDDKKSYQRDYYHQNTEKEKSRKRKFYQEEVSTDAKPIKYYIDLYNMECKDTPIFPCVCCHHLRFLKGVHILKEVQDKISPELSKKSIKYDDSFNVRGNFYICRSCHDNLTNPDNPKRPKISAMNGLEIEEIPQELQLEDVKNQLIAKTLLFMKSKKLPKSRMGAMVDRVVNVPLTDEQIIKSVHTSHRASTSQKVTDEITSCYEL